VKPLAANRTGDSAIEGGPLALVDLQRTASVSRSSE
jgi:hypothetical protein